ncbi:hypothetical protein UA08_06138 [Talaromyces atroroseus]|uniref:ABC transporter domain-containing protein n=1 Tax=Talaromyces atroroseus TaxID=1441469 RepID=A0A225AW33_TALAT|nr:hypothetical protein UA08_06138 [Talaromyces atroroseus]OKL58645.1 hypothetical protein UA08_06138 [Talaromyces atroroseus]
MYLLLQLVSTIGSGLFLLLLPFRLSKLYTETVKVIPDYRRYVKIAIALALLMIQSWMLATAPLPTYGVDIRFLSIITSFISYLFLCPLLFLEHTRSVKPSDLAVVYLIASLACDAAQLGKTNKLPPEQLAGVLSRAFFWWINSILAKGSHEILTADSLPPIDRKLSSELLRRRALRAWDRRHKPEKKMTLPKVLARGLLSPFLAPILPRLSLIVFRYAQPVLISITIRHMSTSSDGDFYSAYAIILMSLAVYVGLTKSDVYDDGRAVTLIGTDAESVGDSAEMFHETWAQAVEVVLGILMLAWEVGWVSPVPLVIIFFTDNRWSMLTKPLIHSLRSQELSRSKEVRWMAVAHNASANALGIFSPIVTFVLFVVLAHWRGIELDTETAFTTTALLGLVTHPANMIMTIIPQAVGSLAAFDRIEQYLLQPARCDQRSLLKNDENHPNKTSPAVCITGVTIHKNDSSTFPILRDINLSIPKGSIVVCSGPVGSGKTTLAKAIIGEVTTTAGTISVSSKRIAYCEQVPWLPSGTLKQAICGFSPKDQHWYEEVVRVCCLEDDLGMLPHGDHTIIGSRGLNLSGGQRQRVALARAVYARYEIVLLDDSLSALDSQTESRIVDNLLGPKGLFRKMGTTVFLISNSATYVSLADWTVILGDASIEYQGTWAELTGKPEDIIKWHVAETHRNIAEENRSVNWDTPNQRLTMDEAISDLSRATGDISLYGYYLQAVGWRNLCILLVCTSSYSFFSTFPQYWLQKWTEAPASQTMFYVGGYLILSLMAWTFTNGSMWSTYILIAPNSGAELHRRLLLTIMKFSQDMQLIDRRLPPALLSMSNLAVIATCLITLAVLQRGGTTAAQIGMALNIVLVTNGTLINLVRSWTSLEISLGAISRLKNLEADTPTEELPSESYIPVNTWPSSGVLEVENITVEYNSGAIALQDVNMTISAGQQVIVCGRTGSGKSTLFLAFLRLLNLNSGVIKIDGIDISTLPQSLIRQRCFITVPQDPFLLPQASLRFNLDPAGFLSDDNIVAALEKTRLWSHFNLSDSTTSSSTPQACEILDSPVISLPQMSTGQAQMFALAQAILKRQGLNGLSTTENAQFGHPNLMPIILLDEATSSLDPETEAVMYRIIHEEFTEKGHTIIAITHRLGGVIEGLRVGRDMIVSLAKGRVERITGVEVELFAHQEQPSSGSYFKAGIL